MPVLTRDTEVPEILRDRDTQEFFGRWEETPEPLDRSLDGSYTDEKNDVAPTLEKMFDDLREAMERTVNYHDITLSIDSRSVGDELFSIVLNAVTESVRHKTRCVFDLGNGPVEIRVGTFTVGSGPFSSDLTVEGEVSTGDMNRLATLAVGHISMSAYMGWEPGGSWGYHAGMCTPSRAMPITGGRYVSVELPQPTYRLDGHGRARPL